MATEDDAVSDELQSSLNHFGVYSLTDDYWRLSEEERGDLRVAWIEKTSGVAEGVRHYRTSPTRVGTDFILWCAVRMQENSDPQNFFDAYASALRPFRRYVSMVDVLWGFTRKTQYRGARDAGLTPVWFRGFHPWPQDVAPPELRIDALSELFSMAVSSPTTD